MSEGLTAEEIHVVAEVERRRDEISDLAAELIRIPSTSPSLVEAATTVVGGEGACNRLLGDTIGSGGLEVDYVEVAPGRANLIGVLRGAGGGRSIALNGHVDTVPPGDLAAWTVDPDGGVIKDGRVWGRGATDMKGAVAAMAKTLEAVRRVGVSLRGDLVLHSVVGEEMFDLEGTQSVLDAGHHVDGCVVGEPTGTHSTSDARTELQVLSIPVLWMRVTLRGRSAHSSARYQWLYPGGSTDLGVNAIEKAVELVRSLQELERQWGLRKRHPLVPAGKFVLHPGLFQGAPEGLSVPALPAERCIVEYVIWHHPDETSDEVKHEVASWIERWASFDPWLVEHPPELEWIGVYPNFATDPEHELVRTIASSLEAVSGRPPPVTSMPAACDATFYGRRGIPVLVYGPGDLTVAHTVDENVRIDDLVEAAKVWAVAALRWCA